MKTLLISLLALLPLSAVAETTVLLGAEVYTVNPKQVWAEAVAIRDGKIIAVGDEASVLNAAGDDAEIVGLGGGLLMPGFQAPHLHALEAGINELRCTLPPVASPAVYLQHLRDCAEAQADRPWVFAVGAQIGSLTTDKQWPVELLDAAVPDHPLLVLDNLGHAAWGNRRALAAVGYDKLVDDPPGGVIQRDPDSGAATGLVLENAQQKLRTAAAPPNADNLDAAHEGLLLALENLAAQGFTSASDAGGYWPRGHVGVWQRAAAEGQLSLRASNALYLYPDRPFEAQMAALKRQFSNPPDGLLRFNQVKIYVDGILSQGTGALYRPYAYREWDLGLPSDGFVYFEPALLKRYAVALDAAGFQLHFHATGDRGVGLALDAVAAAREANGDSDLPHRITHLYLVHPKDRPRFAELGVFADFQLPPDALADDYRDFLLDSVGAPARELLPIRSLLDTGAEVVLSSDWDANPLPPFETLQRAVTRTEQAVPNLSTAVRMMTINVARLLQQAARTGSIEVGKRADLIAVDRNIFALPADQIGRAQVRLTLLDGRPVFDAEGLMPPP